MIGATDPTDTVFKAHGASPKLLGTVCSAPLAQAWRFGEMIVHEAAHSWLYECARAVGEEFGGGATFLSPWKGFPRPLVLFLQAVFAFTAMARYHQLILLRELVATPERREVAQRLSAGLEQIEQAAPTVDEALALVRLPLRPLILDPFQRVRAQAMVAA